MKSIALTIALALAAAACGNEDSMGSAKGSGKPAANGADLTVAKSCGIAPAALTDDGGEPLRHVPAESLRIVQGSDVRAMCDVLKDKPKPLAIYQFTSVTCVPCMEWAHKLNADIVAKGLGDSILSVMVVTDPIGMLSADDERRIKRDVAPEATWVYDDFQDLWKFFSPGDKTAVVPATTPLYVAMDAAQRGYTSEDTSGDADALVTKANSLLGLSIGK
jgi:hypothetical protein